MKGTQDMSSDKKWTQLRIVASFAVKEAFVKFASRSAAPGIVAHDVALDASVNFLAELGFSPADWDEEMLSLATDLMSVGYCIGSAHADERWTEDFDAVGGDLGHTQNKLNEARAESARLSFQLARREDELLAAEGKLRSIKAIYES